jgi:hypothetical protein
VDRAAESVANFWTVTFTSDFRVRVSSRLYTYPDVKVVCGKPLLADERQDILLNPPVIFGSAVAIHGILRSRREVSALSGN